MKSDLKKIILITPMLQPYRITFYRKLSQALAGRAELIVYHGTKKKEDGRPSYTGKVSFREKGFPIRLFIVFRLHFVVNSGMYRSLRKDDPDLVIMQGISGDLSLRKISKWIAKKKKKLVFWTCGWEPGRARGPMMTLKNKLAFLFFSRADFHLTYSTTATKYLGSIGVDPVLIETCFNGIETDGLIEESPSILDQSYKIRKDLKLDPFVTFLYVGGLIPEKRIDLLLDAFTELRRKYVNIKLVIIGDGPLRHLIEEKIKESQDPNILYLGRIIEGVDPYFAASDCFVLPGTGGLALNQAMFWGKTCIAGKADGTEDDLVLEDLTGYRFRENDLRSLMEAMERRINESPENLLKMASASRELIMGKSNVNQMVKIFSETSDRLLFPELQEGKPKKAAIMP